MKIFKKPIAVFISILFTLGLVGCSPKGSTVDFYYFNTAIHVETHGTILSNKTIDDLDALFSSLENSFGGKSQTSLTNRFNLAQKDDTITLSDVEKQILTLCAEYYAYTDKLFTPTISPLLNLWQFAPDYPVLNFTPPSQGQIQSLLSNGSIDFDKLLPLSQENTLVKPDSNLKLDFGGILKGYAADRAGDILKRDGHNAGYVNIGSSSMYLMSVKSLGIRHPRKNNSIISVDTAGLNDLSVSTSGDYEKTYIFDGKTYSHIINPKTGYPADTGIASATIIGADGTFVDAITTALCLCEHSTETNDSELLSLIQKVIVSYPQAKIFIVYVKDGNKQILTNQKQGEDFTLLDNEFTVVNLFN